MKRSVKEHFVPQLYLKRFVNNEEKLEVYDKINKKFFISRPEDVCCEKDYFTPEDAKDLFSEGESIESVSSELDTEYGVILKEFIDSINQNVEIKVDLRSKISWFIVYQYLRSNKMRGHLKRTKNDYRNFISGNIGKGLTDQENAHDSEIIDHALVALNNPMIEVLSNLLTDYIWIFGEMPSDKIAYTSDNPVNLVANQDIGPFSTSFGSPGSEIIFPLSASLILGAHERTHFAKYSSYDLKKIILNEKHVSYYNSLQILRAERQVVASKLNQAFVGEVINRK